MGMSVSLGDAQGQDPLRWGCLCPPSPRRHLAAAEVCGDGRFEGAAAPSGAWHPRVGTRRGAGEPGTGCAAGTAT